MSKPAQTKPTTKPVTKPATSKPAATTAAAEPKAPSDKTLEAIFERWAPPDPVAVDAYCSQYTDAQCIVEGERTKAVLVQRAAATWAVVMDADLRSKNAADLEYGATHFGYYLSLLRSLRQQIATDTGKRGGIQLTKTDADYAETAAKDQDELLLARLHRTIGKRKAENDQLAMARANANATVESGTPEGIAARLLATCDVADQWLARKNAGFQFLLKDHGVTAEGVAAARSAAETLTTARTGARGAGSSAPRDTPAVNLVEGRMLLEMKSAQAAWELGNKKNPAIKKLVVDPGVRQVLGKHRTRTADADTGDAATGQPEAAPTGAPAVTDAAAKTAAGKITRKKPHRRGR